MAIASTHCIKLQFQMISVWSHNSSLAQMERLFSFLIMCECEYYSKSIMLHNFNLWNSNSIGLHACSIHQAVVVGNRITQGWLSLVKHSIVLLSEMTDQALMGLELIGTGEQVLLLCKKYQAHYHMHASANIRLALAQTSNSQQSLCFNLMDWKSMLGPYRANANTTPLH